MYLRPGPEINHPWLLPSSSWEFSGRAGNTQAMPLEGAEWSRWAGWEGEGLPAASGPWYLWWVRQMMWRRGVSTGTRRRNSTSGQGLVSMVGDGARRRGRQDKSAGALPKEGACFAQERLMFRDRSGTQIHFSWFPKLHHPPLPHFLSPLSWSVFVVVVVVFAAPPRKTSAAQFSVY